MTENEQYSEDTWTTQAEVVSLEFERDSRRYSRVLSLAKEDE